MIGEGGTIAYRNSTILAIMNKNLPVWLGWALADLSVVAVLRSAFARPAPPGPAGLPDPRSSSGR